MTRLFFITTLLTSWLLSLHNTHAQRSELIAFDYSKADSAALNYPEGRYDEPAKLAIDLTEDLETEQEKFRAIFRWIAENVEYKYGRKGTDASKVLRKRKAICEGYASLLEAMCHAAGVRCKTVVGFSKSIPEDDIPNSMKATNHAWNAVFLGGEWHLVDVTWAAGYVDPKRRKFYQEFKEHWFLPDPNFFVHTHYPADERWLLNTEPLKKRSFKKAPLLTYAGFTRGVEVFPRTKGYTSRTLKLKFSVQEPFEWAGLKFANGDEMQGAFIVKKSDHYVLKHRFDPEKRQKGSYYLYLDGEAVLGFNHRK